MKRYKYSGKTLRIKDGSGILSDGSDASGKEFVAEDYWVNISGTSWMNSTGNPACLEYALRTGCTTKHEIPFDDNVIYGKIGMIGHLFHESELELKCLDPVMKYCQCCPYGSVHYPDDVETYEDTFGASFTTSCMYGLENQPPTAEEEKQFADWCNKGETENVD